MERSEKIAIRVINDKRHTKIRGILLTNDGVIDVITHAMEDYCAQYRILSDKKDEEIRLLERRQIENDDHYQGQIDYYLRDRNRKDNEFHKEIYEISESKKIAIYWTAIFCLIIGFLIGLVF